MASTEVKNNNRLCTQDSCVLCTYDIYVISQVKRKKVIIK